MQHKTVQDLFTSLGHQQYSSETRFIVFVLVFGVPLIVFNSHIGVLISKLFPISIGWTVGS